MDARPDKVTLAAFAVLVLLGGLNALAVRFTNFELPPFWGAAARFALAGGVFGGALLALRLPRPAGPALRGVLLFGALNFGAGYALAYWGLVHVKAGLAMVILATVPLLTLLLAVAHRVEGFRWRALGGALVAGLGIAVVFADQLQADAPPLALLAILATALCWSEAAVLLKRYPGAHPVATNALGMLVGVPVLLGLSAGAGEPRLLPAAAATWWAFGYLVAAGSIVLFLLYLFVLGRWTASAASYQFLLYPLVALAASAWLDDERLTPALAAGGALVLLGVYLGAFSGRRGPASSHAAPPEAASVPPEQR